MIEGKRVIAIIPARGGSKGLPRKNILPLCNKPLISYTIESALQCDFIDCVMVSTDDNEIAEISKSAGAEIPYLRPPHLATDTATSYDVILDCLNWYSNHAESFDYFILLQPTSPLRTKADIDSAFKLLIDKKAKAIVSVCESDHHPYWMNTLPPDHNLNLFEKEEYRNIGRQQLPTYYRLNGAIYLTEINYFLEQKSFMGKDSYALVMNKMHSIDIDDKFDFSIAEFILKQFK